MTRRLSLPVDDEAAFADFALARRPFRRSVSPPTYQLLR
jgi:hypothetical protein